MIDRNSDPIKGAVPKRHLLHGQFAHLLLLAALVPGVWALASPSVDGGAWLGIDERVWLYVAVLVPIVHQVVVALLWRAQLSHSALTRLFGDSGFVVWGLVFMPLLIARPLSPSISVSLLDILPVS